MKTSPTTDQHEQGTLIIVSTPIGNIADLSPRALQSLQSVGVVLAEDTRHTGLLLTRSGIRSERLVSLHAHNETERIREVLELLSSGTDVALVSDAGTPLVSDPGERLVAATIAAGHRVSAVPGPSAVLAAIVTSGFSLSRWRFEGFLPRKGRERRDRIKEVASSSCPSVVYESPQRIDGTLRDLRDECGGDRCVTINRELTKLHEEVWHGTLDEAIEHTGGRPARGEHVVVIDRAQPVGQGLADDELEHVLRVLVEAGLGRHDAVKAVEALYGVAHRRAYAASLGRKKDSPQRG